MDILPFNCSTMKIRSGFLSLARSLRVQCDVFMHILRNVHVLNAVSDSLFYRIHFYFCVWCNLRERERVWFPRKCWFLYWNLILLLCRLESTSGTFAVFGIQFSHTTYEPITRRTLWFYFTSSFFYFIWIWHHHLFWVDVRAEPLLAWFYGTLTWYFV